MDSSQYTQGSTEWFQARCGRITASRIADVMEQNKNGSWSAKRIDYLWELVEERITGVCMAKYVNAAMQWGTETEPEAREFFEGKYEIEVDQTGFIQHPGMDYAGASPDGLIGADGLIEIKCPTTKTMLQTINDNKPDERYVMQVQWQMACTNSRYAWLVYYDPRLPLDMCMKRFWIERNDALITKIQNYVHDFNLEINDTILAIKENARER